MTRLPIGLLAFALAVALFKAARLSLDVSGAVWGAGAYLAQDLTALGILLLSALLAGRFDTGPVRRVCLLLLALLVLFYALHSVVLLELDEHMSLFDLARYLPEASVVASFIGPGMLMMLAVLLAALAWSRTVGKKGARWLTIIGVLAILGGLWVAYTAPRDLGRYGLVPVSRLAEIFSRQQGASRYTRDQAEHFSRSRLPPAEIPAARPNIVLLIVESLSSINSLRAGGVTDLMPQFDRLSQRGVLMVNFFANHAASEGGIISLLSGFPPVHFPTASPLMFDEFAAQPAVVNEYQEAGYHVEFLTNADLGFIGLDRYLAGIGADQARGRDEVTAFEGLPRFVQDAPSDRYLYRESLKRIEQLGDGASPWLLAVATVSTHLPYTHPEGGEDSAEAVWAWSLDRLVEFVDALDNRDFFNNGLLLVTGDHRQMRPVTDHERARFGETVRARVPLLAIGPTAGPARLDPRLWQQSDLLRYLARLPEGDAALSPWAVWVERYNRIYGRVDAIGRVRVFVPGAEGIQAYPLTLLGTEIEWPGQRPARYRTIEAQLHAQRSAHQFIRVGSSPACQPGIAKAGMTTGTDPGLAAWSGSGLATALRVVTEIGDRPPGSLEVDELRYLAYLEVSEPGVYWFRIPEGLRGCMSINGELVLDQLGDTPMQAPVELESGLHLVDLVFGAGQDPALQWVPPGRLRWRWQAVPGERFVPAQP
ncbi:MAG: sulfatase-like hydrolase/transferase [Xanthomonadales bacterium]|nr:sulfatase-like hydrolase/transferase [Xanthomonadales bacterium]